MYGVRSYKVQKPSSMMRPHRPHLTRLSSKQRPIPRGNQKTAASTPADTSLGSRSRHSNALELTKKAIAGMWYMPLLQADHLRMVWGKKGRDDLVGRRVDVIIHSRRRHGWAHRRRWRACGRICLGGLWSLRWRDLDVLHVGLPDRDIWA